MQSAFALLNEPLVLWSLLIGGAVLVLIDYFFPVDWPAYVGYICFSIFFGATAPLGPVASLILIGVLLAILLLLHYFVLSVYLTNAPRYEKAAPDVSLAGPPSDSNATSDGERGR